MKEVIFGEEIRRVRLERGLTQERLSEGICSPSTLSRIENGSQVPSRRTFQLLMERLDGPDYSYAHFLSPIEYQRERIKEEIIEAIEYRQVDRMKDLLGEMEDLLEGGDRKLTQFFEMSKLVCYEMCGASRQNYVDRCLQILEMGRPGWREDTDLRIAWGRLDVMRGDWVEMWILNNLAIGYMWQQEYERSCQIFAFLYRQTEGDAFIKKRSWKTKGIICNNIAVCLLNMGKLEEAGEYLKKASALSHREGGINLFLHLLQVKMEISKAMEDRENYYRENLLLKRLYLQMPQYTVLGMGGCRFYIEQKELLIL